MTSRRSAGSFRPHCASMPRRTHWCSLPIPCVVLCRWPIASCAACCRPDRSPRGPARREPPGPDTRHAANGAPDRSRQGRPGRRAVLGAQPHLSRRLNAFGTSLQELVTRPSSRSPGRCSGTRRWKSARLRSCSTTPAQARSRGRFVDGAGLRRPPGGPSRAATTAPRGKVDSSRPATRTGGPCAAQLVTCSPQVTTVGTFAGI